MIYVFVFCFRCHKINLVALTRASSNYSGTIAVPQKLSWGQVSRFFLKLTYFYWPWRRVGIEPFPIAKMWLLVATNDMLR